MILEKTGEPLDVVMSYANFTLQNTRLSSIALPRLKAAGVDVVPNASVLGMGLLRRKGVPIGGQGDFHPSPIDLRAKIQEASHWVDAHNDRIEKVAIRFALETWMREGSEVGSMGDPASGIPWKRETIQEVGGKKLGVSVMGVSSVEELDETMRVWRSILDGLENGVGEEIAMESGRGRNDHAWSLRRQKEVNHLARGIRKVLGNSVDYAWASPDPDFVNIRSSSGHRPEPLLTPAASPEQLADTRLLPESFGSTGDTRLEQ